MLEGVAEEEGDIEGVDKERGQTQLPCPKVECLCLGMVMLVRFVPGIGTVGRECVCLGQG